MSTLKGSLKTRRKLDLASYRVTATYERRADLDGRVDLPYSQSAEVDSRGEWQLELNFEPVGQVALTARTASGVAVGSRMTEDLRSVIAIAVTDLPSPIVIPPSADPTLGRTVSLTGRALQPDGSGVPAGLPVVLFGKPTASTPLPVLVAATSEGGYFSGDWPASSFQDGWGSVDGGAAIPVQLVEQYFPRVVLLVVPTEIQVPSTPDDDDCDCHTPQPPRTPDAAELVANPEAFSADAGGCVNFTTPNRTLEEVVFHAVVRTTEPEIRGTTLDDPNVVPAALAQRIGLLAGATSSQRAVVAQAQTLRLDTSVVADQLHDGLAGTALGRAELGGLELRTNVKDIRHYLDLIGPYLTPGRVTLDDDHTIDWDDDPTIYQATSIAIGHLLTLKQVWRADGYSLGDLLYSLPLAPGQKKQIAIVDWERKEQTVRQSRRDASESLAAELTHDRDIADIIDSSLTEHSRGSSTAHVSAVGGGIGAFIGPVVLGGGGGSSNANSTAQSHSWRDVSGTALNQARDRTQQAANVVRGQRSSTVQTTTQGESLRAQTEVVANYNHCHALSIEYFEVLRHFKVSVELADARECLFVPFDISVFTANKALRWREALAGSLSRWDLAGGFDALERARTGWAYADYPGARYADEDLSYLDGDVRMTFDLPRPADDAGDQYVAANWAPWALLMPNVDPQKVWTNYIGNVLPSQRDQVWNQRLAPFAAAKLVDSIYVTLVLTGGSRVVVPVDPTLVSGFRQDGELEVSLDLDLSGINVTRRDVQAIELGLGAAVPYTAKVVIRSGSLYYRTDHLAHQFFVGYSIDHELSVFEHATIHVHLDRTEKRNPRKEDVLLGARLVTHLNERLEFYHQAIWLAMHPNRRYLLLDGVIAPNAGGRSVASVVENRLVGIVGNCLVLPVVPGRQLDPNYESDKRRKTTLLDLYAVDAPPPTRISVPTKGVFAEAVLGACNSCEKKDDTRFWRWEESPIPDQPMAISSVGTGSRRTTPPDLRPDAFPDPIVAYQQIPGSPDPTGLAAALKLIGTPNVFRDLTGLDLNQQASAAAFSKALETAQFFGQQAGNLAQQRYANREMDRNLDRVKQAVDDKMITPEQGSALTEQFIRSGSGKGASATAAPTSTRAVKKVIDRASASQSGTLSVSRPSGSVEVKTGGNAAMEFDVSPSVVPIKQPTPNLCWAAAGAMLQSWKQLSPLSVTAAADAAGAAWRTRVDDDKPLNGAETKGYMRAIGMTGENPMCYLPRGLFALLKQHGPLWVVGDDAVPDNKMAHARVVTGMHGDGTSDGTEVGFVDPADGLAHHESFTAFSAHLEASDPVSTHLGIYHF